MIKIFEKEIKENLAEYLSPRDFPLSYLKFSTVTSGSGLNDKVIFLVFKHNDPSPFLCLKTVRNYGAKEAIFRNFNNLKKLNTLTRGSSYDRLFAQTRYLYDDGENVFSVETACLGKRVKLDKEKLRTVVVDYINFQEYLAKSSVSSLRDMGELAKEAVVKSGLNERDQHKLLEYIAKLPSTEVRLPRIIQHGDLTPDNLLLSENGLCVIDYDYVGSSDIPSFDLFGLFRRFDRASLAPLCKEYFPTYFKKIGGESRDESYSRLLFLYHLTEHTQDKLNYSKNISFEQIISDFGRLYPVTLFS